MNTKDGLNIIFLKFHLIILLIRITSVLMFLHQNRSKSFKNFSDVNLYKIKDNEKFNLFIDVTKIYNKSGHESVYTNPEYKKKKITPLIVICDHN